MQNNRRCNARYVYSLCCIATLGGVMFGYSTGVISGTVDSIQAHFQLDPSQTGWVVSSIFVGCIIGSLAAGKLAEKLGRKPVLMLATIAFALSAVGSTFADSFTLFSAARIVAGLGIGLAGTVAPMYMGEIAPASIRGKASGIFNLSLVGSQTLVFLVNYLIGRGMSEAWLIDEGWRWMMGAQFVPVAMMLFCTLILPESPQWCINHQQGERALRVLEKIYPDLNKEEARQIISVRSESKNAGKGSGSLRYIWQMPVLRYALIVGCTIAVLQQLTGASIVMYYAPLILNTGEMAKDTLLFQTIFIGLLNAMGAFIAMNLYDRFGRLPVMKLGTVGAIIALLLLSWSMYTQQSGYLAIISALLFMMMFAISWGAGCWVLISEIFPPRIKSYAMGLAVSLMWIFNFLVTQFFPVLNEIPALQQAFHGAFSFWIFAAINLFCLIFLLRFVPETRGVALDDIEQLLASRMNPVSASSTVPMASTATNNMEGKS
ncbi:MFS transporter [Pantoea sp. YU22]|uniref:D-xylose-proton symporter n=1 Tax=Pantoea piersonii TaxID=2364647 RepID=A0AAJ5QNW8_9GAMM|nr:MULTISPECIES: sugar porter family MFS transporter [Pantoea]RTY58364.1 MFS transporter [Pantoea sp. YU22]WBG93506.1 sugar porter family MFS transporter [Pantoea piersonii]